MKKIITCITAGIILFLIGLLIGRFAFQKTETVVKIVKQEKIVTKWRTKVITKKNVIEMPCNELQKELLKFVDAEPELEIKILKDKEIIRATAALGDREWSRDAKFKVEVARNKHFKLYLGMTAAIVAVGVTSHILIKKFAKK